MPTPAQKHIMSSCPISCQLLFRSLGTHWPLQEVSLRQMLGFFLCTGWHGKCVCLAWQNVCSLQLFHPYLSWVSQLTRFLGCFDILNEIYLSSVWAYTVHCPLENHFNYVHQFLCLLWVPWYVLVVDFSFVVKIQRAQFGPQAGSSDWAAAGPFAEVRISTDSTGHHGSKRQLYHRTRGRKFHTKRDILISNDWWQRIG